MQIGPYQVLLELGRGGMGTVYLARLVGAGGFERLVAIKRAHTQSLGQQENALERFLREARLAASIHHANVVGIHQIGEDHDGPYLACDYVEGESLSGLIEGSARAEPIPVHIALRVVLDALAGLHAAHETVDSAGRPLGILHRDVSIENLLVGRDGVTRLTDFGIAKTAVGPGLTEAGTIHGKLLYLTPEYLEGAASTRSDDTYAMGVTLWIALAGAFPYRSRDNNALVREVLEQPIPSLSVVGVRVGPMLEAVLARAVSRSPAQRFQSAREMLDALEAVSAHETRAARHLDVAEFVERVAGVKLAARRTKIQLQGAGRALPATALPKASAAVQAWAAVPTAAPRPASGAVPLDAPPAAAPKLGAAVLLDTQPDVIVAPRARNVGMPRWLIGAGGAIIAAGVLAFAVRFLSAASAPPSDKPDAASAVAAPEPKQAEARSSGTEQGRVLVEPLHDAAALAPSLDAGTSAVRAPKRAGEGKTRPRTNSDGPRPSQPDGPPAIDIATDNPYR